MSENIRFTIGYVIRKLREINPLINRRHSNPFPKEEARRLSHYESRKEYVHIHDDGSVRGRKTQLVASIIDFSFIRSIAGVAYSIFGGPCYDPVSLFLLDLFRYLDGIRSIKDFCLILRDSRRGQNYRSLAGIRDDCIPCQATFSNFYNRIGESLYQKIFHVLVSIVKELGLLSFKIPLATDGTLFPAAARYHGCCCFNDSCASISVEEALLERGYDCNGWPYVPYCHLPTRPYGFDPAARRLSFSCFKQCVKSNLPSNLELYRNCPNRANRLGFSTHVSIAQHPRLILEIPRGTERYRELHSLRSASERTNSTLKEDNSILRKPPVRSLRRAAVVSQMGVITTLIDRITRFVIENTIKERKYKGYGSEAVV